jgi:preprotein translocase subunit SecY
VATGIQTTLGGTGTNNWVYWLLYFLMVVSFTFFYTSVLFEQQNYGDNLKKAGAQVPGVHTGDATQKYLNRVQQRITLPGAFFLGLVAALPFILSKVLALFNIASSSSASGLFLVSSAGLLIVVGVVRDTFLNIEAELKLHGYQDTLLVH